MISVLTIILWPLIYIVSASLSDPLLINQGKIWLYPKGINLNGYVRVFNNSEILIGYWNSILYTVFGTALNLFMTFTAAYPLSKEGLVGKKFFMIFLTVTMFFGGGLVPTYLLINSLGMRNTFWVMVIPGAVSVWNIILVKTYLTSQIPGELYESAKIDGCSNIKLLYKIVIPLSKPIIAVMTLFYAVGHWNAYFDALIYLSNRKLYPLQMFLSEILVRSQISDSMMRTASGNMESMARQALIADQIKYCVIIVSSIPMLILYSFVQKYFIKGIMVGSLKG